MDSVFPIDNGDKKVGHAADDTGIAPALDQYITWFGMATVLRPRQYS